jgi:hypothetical protein
VGARPLPLAAALAAAALAAAVALPAATATAQDEAKPVPGCAGQSFTDPRGDQVDDPLGLGLGGKGADNVDIVGGFFRQDGGVVTANIQVANLTMDVPELATGLNYYMYYAVAGALRFVSAESDGETVVYSFGTLDTNTGLFMTDGETRGKVFPGPDGVIQIEVPAAAGGKAGTILASPYAEADNQTLLLVSPADQAPDSLRGESLGVGECTEGAPAPAPVQEAALPFRAPAVLGSAARANRSKSLAFKVRATKTITGLRVVLRGADGKGRAFASGRRSWLRGTATLRLRVLRKLRPGAYSLKATGAVAGKTATVAQQVTLRR